MRTTIILFLLLFIKSYTIGNENIKNAYLNYSKKNYSKSIQLIKKAIPELEENDDIDELCHAYYGLSSAYYALGKTDSAFKYIIITDGIQTSNEIKENRNKTLNMLGSIYIEKGLNHQAIYYLKKAAELNSKEDNYKSLSKSYINLGTAYSNLSLVDSSNRYYLLCSDLLSNNGMPDNPTLFNNIASNFFFVMDFDKSKEFLNKAIEQKGNDNLLDSLLYQSNLELINVLHNNNDQAYIFTKYLAESKSKDEFLYADANYKLSIYQLFKGNIDSSVFFLNTANSIYVSLGNIDKAKEISSFFLKQLKLTKNLDLKYSLNELTNLQVQQYSLALQSEIENRIQSERVNENLKEELYYSSISFYMVLFILIAFISSLLSVIYKVLTSKLIANLRAKLRFINEIQTNSLVQNLSKLTAYISIRNDINDIDKIGLLLDNVINDTNKLNKYLLNAEIHPQTKRLKNASKFPTTK